VSGSEDWGVGTLSDERSGGSPRVRCLSASTVVGRGVDRHRRAVADRRGRAPVLPAQGIRDRAGSADRPSKALGDGPTSPPPEVADLVNRTGRSAAESSGPAGGVGGCPGRSPAWWCWPCSRGPGVWLATGTETDEPVYVALVAGMSGEAAVTPAHMERGLRMRPDTVNENDGVDGRLVEMQEGLCGGREDRSREQGHVRHRARCQRHLTRGEPVYERARIPAITPSASSWRITDGGD
jgi:branched-chain amino acid transport system substrate-binding protein